MRTPVNTLRPFEFMKLVRDGDTTAITMLHMYGATRMSHFLHKATAGLTEAGFAENEGERWLSSLKPTEAFL